MSLYVDMFNYYWITNLMDLVAASEVILVIYTPDDKSASVNCV
jgi:hypothetical protein